MKANFLTDQGQVRKHNEDAGGIYYNSTGQVLAIIADGMGGHQAGDVASQMAVSIMQTAWEKTDEFTEPEQAEEWMSETFKKMNLSIFNHALEKEVYKGMGTTVVSAIGTDEFIIIGHIGDSRCYLRNEDGFKQITEDHSLVNELVRSGEISHEDAEHHPRKNIVLKAMGTEENVSADIRCLSWEQGNQVVLCSDGLSDKMTNKELGDYVQAWENKTDIGQELIDLANERGGEDNISLAIISHQPSEEAGGQPC